MVSWKESLNIHLLGTIQTTTSILVTRKSGNTDMYSCLHQLLFLSHLSLILGQLSVRCSVFASDLVHQA